MKNRIFSLLAAAWLLFAAVLPSAAGIEEVTVLKDGIAAGNAASYSYEGRLYLNAFQAGRILGGKIDILGASGRVILTAKRSKLIFSESSDNVIINGGKKEYPKPLIVRAGVPFILSQCIAGSDFSGTYGKKISFETVKPEAAGDKQPAIDNGRTAAHDSNAKEMSGAAPAQSAGTGSEIPAEISSVPKVKITGIRCADHEGSTRLVISLSAKAGWTKRRLRDALLIEIQGASAENISAGNIKGREIQSAVISAGSSGAAIMLSLSDTAGRSEIFSLSNPDRIVSDVFALKPGETIQYGSADVMPQSNDMADVRNNSQENESAGNIHSDKENAYAESPLKEELKEPDITEENIEDYPLLKPAVSEEKDTEISVQAEKAKNIVRKNNSNVSGLKMARKDKKGKTIKKTSVSDSKEAVLPAKVLAGLKASGIKYSDGGTAGQKTSKNAVSEIRDSAAGVSAHKAGGDKVPVPEKRLVAQEGKIIVVLDPAHGGKDEGGPRKFGLSEKQYALHLARDIQKAFADDSRFQVVLTRNSDVFMPLKKRTAIAAELNASVFISLHANGVSGSPSKKGFEVFSLADSIDEDYGEMLQRENAVTSMENENDRPDAASMLRNQKAFELRDESARLAGIISAEIARGTQFKNNGAKKSGLTVLRLAEMPAVCLFAGYMTNSADKQNMDNKLFRMRIARSVYKGVTGYAEMRGWIK